MNPGYSAVMLAVLVAALIGHYLTQKSLLAKGWLAIDPQPQIKRLGLNGAVLCVVALVALMTADFPYGLVGILLFIEAAVCVAFARKLRNK
jgi:hypothetical protein